MGRFRENSEKEGHIWRARRKMWISRGTIYRENKEGTHREIGKTYGEVEISSKKWRGYMWIGRNTKWKGYMWRGGNIKWKGYMLRGGNIKWKGYM